MQRAMAKKLLIAVAVVVAVLLVVIAIQPADFSIERKTSINAAPSFAYAQVDDFHKWGNWSPWEKMEGAAGPQKTYSGPNSGVGSHYAWSGEKTGTGEMTITETKPSEKLAIDLHFIKPFEARNVATFAFAPTAAGGTDAAWSMTGKRNFMSKAFSLVMDMDKMVGPDFEKGLAGIKRLAEADAKAAADAMAGGGVAVDAGVP